MGMVTFKTAVRSSPPFEWDPAKKYDKLVLSNNNKTASTPANNSSHMCALSKNKISANSMTEVQWELTIRKRDSREGYARLRMGFIDEAHYASAKLNSFFGQDSDGYRGHAFRVYSDSDRFKSYTNGKYTDLTDIGHSPKNLKNGDRLEIKFDFVSNEA